MVHYLYRHLFKKTLLPCSLKHTHTHLTCMSLFISLRHLQSLSLSKTLTLPKQNKFLSLSLSLSLFFSSLSLSLSLSFSLSISNTDTHARYILLFPIFFAKPAKIFYSRIFCWKFAKPRKKAERWRKIKREICSEKNEQYKKVLYV